MKIKDFKKLKFKKLNRYGMDGKAVKSNIPELKQYNFRSRLEVDHAIWLLSEKQAGRIISFEYEKRYRLSVNGQKICDIVPDFTVTLSDNRIQIHEIKSPATQTNEWRIKSNLFQALYPNLKYKVNPRSLL